MKSKLSNRENNIAMIIVMTVIMLLITTFSIVGVLAGIVVYDMGKYTEEKYIMTMNQMPALLKDLGYELEGENNKEESIRVDEAKTFIANSVCYSSHLYYRDESNAILDNRERTPFYEMTVFNSRIKGIREKYIDLFLINEDTKPLSKEKYSSLVKRGYEGYIAEKNGIIRLMIYKDREVIVIRSHEEFTEENVLKLLEG